MSAASWSCWCGAVVAGHSRSFCQEVMPAWSRAGKRRIARKSAVCLPRLAHRDPRRTEFSVDGWCGGFE